MKTLIIDNYDSFTYNLFQYLAEINGMAPIVVKNDQVKWSDLQSLDFDNIVISPGPGRPDRDADFGVSRDAILKADVPVLGVCLGHQGIGHLSGGRVRHAPVPMHGRLSPVIHDGSDLFAGLPSPFQVVRYHSLIVEDDLPPDLVRQAWTADGLIMGMRSRSRPVWGVQFHPESICTEHGFQLLANFKRLTEIHAGKPASTEIRTTAIREPARKAGPQPGAAGLRVRSRRLGFCPDSERVFLALYGQSETAFWLDSSRIHPGLSRFSFMGDATGPRAEIVSYRTNGRQLTIRRNGTTTQVRESVLDYLRREMKERRIEADGLPFDFAGGYVGYFGYEMKAECGSSAAHTARTPDASFIFADRFIAFDHEEKAVWLVHVGDAADAVQADEWFDAIAARLAGPFDDIPHQVGGRAAPVRFRLRHGRAGYHHRIRQSLEEIRNGESYEICLTNQITAQADPDPLGLYRILRSINPAPHAAFLRLPDLNVMCSSPERFLKIDRDGMVEAKPIKGTLPRGRTPQEDDAMREALLSSEKDRAENLMIVDLLRNDLGLVSEIGSVHVPRLMDIESYATVHQMVSTIRSRLHRDFDMIDAVRAAFPGGSMTGAPKIRTMDIIDRLEAGPRGVYSGAIGFLSLNGTLDFNIVIRTIVAERGRLSIGCGGAITALSNPGAEFDEIILKARAPMRAIALAVTGLEDAYVVEGIDEKLTPAPIRGRPSVRIDPPVPSHSVMLARCAPALPRRASADAPRHRHNAK